MLEDRNKTSHIYDESTANEIFERIKQKYINLMEENLKLFAAYLASEK
ncbi:MAG: nucleotidyltransferase substrate binding protein [Thermodesulfovibrionales bacterium]|nr:nucleotidyltransferase substrate binding protein [Thermodesulfovibrionales bacterium]